MQAGIHRRTALALAAIALLGSAHSVSLAAAPATMQAIILQDGKLQLQTVSRPAPGPREVLVQVRAAGVNPADWKRAARPSSTPVTPGWDIAGTIVALGPEVSGWKVGDAVMGFFEGVGGYAQYGVLSVDNIARKPAKTSFEEAAGYPLVVVTAWKALVEVANLQKGQRVLIHGAAGGVGSAAVQIAADRGAYIIATASPRNHDFLRALGVKELIDYNKVKFEDVLSNVDVVLNTIDEEMAARSLKVLKPEGIMVTVAGSAPAAACTAAQRRCATQSRKTGATAAQVMAEIGKLADAGRFSMHVDAKYPLAQAAAAWELSKAGHTRGKIVLTMPE